MEKQKIIMMKIFYNKFFNCAKKFRNTCYMNSSFQILLLIPEFVELMIKNNDYEDNHIYYINKLINLFINNYKNNFTYYINPSLFVY